MLVPRRRACIIRSFVAPAWFCRPKPEKCQPRGSFKPSAGLEWGSFYDQRESPAACVNGDDRKTGNSRRRLRFRSRADRRGYLEEVRKR
jgi:hypothetical protein